MASSPHSTQASVARRLVEIFGPAPQCRRVLLVKPLGVNAADFDGHLARNRRYYNYPPYGIGILCTHLKQRGYRVKLLDLNMAVLQAVLAGEVADTEAATITDWWQMRLREALIQFAPDVMGISCTFTMSHDMMLAVADAAKKMVPRLPVVAGGVHVTAAAETVLKEGRSIDLACLFDGDLSFCELLEVVNRRLKVDRLSQLSVLVDDQVICIDKLRVPTGETIDVIPDYEALPIGEYRRHGEVGVFRCWIPPEVKGSIVLSNRGCRGRCSFCTVWSLNQKRVRCRKVQAVVTEIEQLHRRYGVGHITWLDDDLFYDAERALALFREIQSRQLDLTWDASNGIITAALARCPELIEAAVASGCIGMYFGIESGSPEILKLMRKPSGVEHHRVAGHLLQKYPQVFTRGFLMIGYPGETLGQMFETVALARAMDLDWYTVSLLTPLPGTEVYDTLVQEGSEAEHPGHEESDLTHLRRFVGYGYAVRHAEDRRLIEQSSQTFGAGFDPEVIPTREALNDLWLLIDYQVNYEKILTQSQPLKLVKMQRFLEDVTDRMTQANPLANLFLSIVYDKLGQPTTATERRERSQTYLQGSPYWQSFFETMNLNRLYTQTFTGVTTISNVPRSGRCLNAPVTRDR